MVSLWDAEASRLILHRLSLARLDGLVQKADHLRENANETSAKWEEEAAKVRAAELDDILKTDLTSSHRRLQKTTSN